LKNLIIDIDGTIIDGNREINNSSLFINKLENIGSNFILATNSIKSHEVQVARLKKIGINVEAKKIYTPIDSINLIIKDKKISNAMIIGTHEEICQIKVNNTIKNPEVVILLDFEKEKFGYRELQLIIDKIENGCPVISASGSPYYLKDGKKHLDTGAFVTLIESVSGKRVEILGKPSNKYFLNAGAILGSKNDNVYVIGDDWNTDILGAKNAGFRSILIKSGKYRRGDENKGKPDFLVDNLTDLLDSDM